MPSRSKSRNADSISLPGVYVQTSMRYRTTAAKKTWNVIRGGPYGASVQRRSGNTSVLQDETGNDGSFRPCTHDTIQYVANPVDSQVLTWDSSLFKADTGDFWITSGLQTAIHQENYQRFLDAIGTANLPNLNNINWGSLSQSALESMLPSLGGQNSYVNYILELKDFRTLASALTSDVNSKLEKLYALLGFGRRDRPLQRLSKAYLSYKFGWESLYNDVQSFINSFSNMFRKMDTLVKLADTDLQAHFRTTVSGSSSSQTTNFDSGLIGGHGARPGVAGRVVVTTLPSDGIKYSATLRYRYPLPPELREVHGRLKGFLDVLGVAVNPAIVWNAIPFTFLVDYFVNVGKWLNRLRIDNIRFQTQIRGFCHSAKITREVKYELQAFHGYSDSANNLIRSSSGLHIVDYCRKSSFRRKVGIPNFLTAFQVTGLNPYEFSIAGALAGSKKRT